MLVPIVLGIGSWRLPLIRDFEAQAFDRYTAILAPRTPPRRDIVILAYDETTARELGRFSPTPKRLLASALRNLDRLGARGIGIDITMTVRTEDAAELAEALSAVRTPTVVAYADPEFDRATYWNPESDVEARSFQAEFWGQIRNPRVRPASPVVRLDHDGVRRHWPDLHSALRPTISLALLGGREGANRYEGSIDYIVGAATGDAGPGVFDTIPLAAFAEEDSAVALADLVRGRYVLIGVDLDNVDEATVPVFSGNNNSVSGVYIHAQMLAQAIDGRLRPPVPTWIVIFLLVLAVAGGVIAALLGRNPWLLGSIATVELAALLALPFAVQAMGHDRITLPLVGIGLTWLVAFLGGLFLVRRSADARTRYAQGALGKYLPKAVANEIIRDPSKLDLTGQRRGLFIMFTDLEGFTAFSEDIDPHVVAVLLNDYLELVSGIVLKHEGTLDKYVGDAVVAFWGAPLQNERDAENALNCAIEISERTEIFRVELRDRGASLGRTRIGLHFGDAVVGNFGGVERIQYTAIGDAVNTAARLEGLNKYLGSHIVVSGGAAERMGLERFIPLGRVLVAGRTAPIELFQPRDETDASLASEVRQAYSRYQKGETSAAAEIARLGEQTGDEAVLLFAQRLSAHGPGEAYAFHQK